MKEKSAEHASKHSKMPLEMVMMALHIFPEVRDHLSVLPEVSITSEEKGWILKHVYNFDWI